MTVALVQTALELGLICSLTVLALFLSYSMLNVCDLSTDGCFTLGAAVGAIVAISGHPYLAILAAMADPSLSDEEYTEMIGDLLETFMESDPFVWVATCPYVYGMIDNISGVEFIPWGFPRFHHAEIS